MRGLIRLAVLLLLACVAGPALMDLESGPRATIVFRRDRQGELGNTHLSRETYWWDIATGAWLRREVELVRGSGANRPSWWCGSRAGDPIGYDRPAATAGG